MSPTLSQNSSTIIHIITPFTHIERIIIIPVNPNSIAFVFPPITKIYSVPVHFFPFTMLHIIQKLSNVNTNNASILNLLPDRSLPIPGAETKIITILF